MRTQPVPHLPVTLVAQLGEIGHKLSLGKSVSSIFGNTAQELLKLPIVSLSRLDWQISEAAGLYRRRRSFFQMKDGEQLRKTIGLEYLFLFHNDGRLREASLNKLRGPQNSNFVIAMIIWRMNDWVSEVRDAAVACAKRTFPISDPTALVGVLRFLLPRLNGWQRWNLGGTDLRGVLLQPAVIKTIVRELLQEVGAKDSKVIRYLLESSEIDICLEELALRAQSPMVRMISARTLLSQIATWESHRNMKVHGSHGSRRMEPVIQKRAITVPVDIGLLLPLLAKDPSPFVKCLVLDKISLERAGFAFSGQIASELRNDPAKPVRERAELVLAKMESGGWLARSLSPPPTADNT